MNLLDNDRYYNQRWYIKLWRMRHYFNVPVLATSIWITEKAVYLKRALNALYDLGDEFPFEPSVTYLQAWSFAVNHAHLKMKRI